MSSSQLISICGTVSGCDRGHYPAGFKTTDGVRFCCHIPRATAQAVFLSLFLEWFLPELTQVSGVVQALLGDLIVRLKTGMARLKEIL